MSVQSIEERGNVTEQHEPKRLQLVEVVGDSDEVDGWLYVPVHLLNGVTGEEEHVELFMDPQTALDMAITLHGLLNVYAGRSAVELARKRQELN